jgi:lysyl-tRNA synthetase class I
VEYTGGLDRSVLRDSDDEQQRQTRRIEQLLNERQKLLQAHYADAVTIDQLKVEQQRITTDLAAAHTLLTRAEVTQERIEAGVANALAWVRNLATKYQSAEPRTKREINQALYEHIFIGRDGHASALPKEEISLITHADVRRAAADNNQRKNQNIINGAEQLLRTTAATNKRTLTFAGQGSRNDWLVGVEGLEPPTITL